MDSFLKFVLLLQSFFIKSRHDHHCELNNLVLEILKHWMFDHFFLLSESSMVDDTCFYFIFSVSFSQWKWSVSIASELS